LQQNIHEQNSTRKKLSAILFILILVNFVGFSLSYSLLFPAYEGPDEAFHYSYVVTMLHGPYLEARYYMLPPLYYSINALVLNTTEHQIVNEIKINPDFDFKHKNKFIHSTEEDFPFSGTSSSVHLLRLVSIAMSVITLIFVYKTAKLLFSEHRWLPLFTMAFVSLIPKFTAISSLINNDSLVWLFSTIAIFFFVKYINSPSRRQLLFIGIFTGLAILTKANGIMLFLIFFTILLYLWRKHTFTLKKSLKEFGLFILITIPAGSWYTIQKFAANVTLENISHPVGFYRLFQAASKASSAEHVNLLEGVLRWGDLGLVRGRMFDMMWGNVGWHVFPNDEFYLDLALGFSLIAGAGLFLIFIKRTPLQDISFIKNGTFVIFSTAGFYLFGMLLYLAISRPSGDIRYAFPAIAAFGILYAIGFYSLLDKKRLKYLMIVPIILLAAMNVNLFSDMYDNYYHGFLEYENPYDVMLEIYNSRGDIRKAYPGAADGSYAGLVHWSQKWGANEHLKLQMQKPMLDLLHIYYNDKNLQKQFPEVDQHHDLQNLVTWAVTEGKNDYGKIHDGEFLIKRYQNFYANNSS